MPCKLENKLIKKIKHNYNIINVIISTHLNTSISASFSSDASNSLSVATLVLWLKSMPIPIF